MPKVHPTVSNMWAEFASKNRSYRNSPQAPAWYFCDNKKDADECAELVVKGIKKATSPSLWWYEHSKTPLPKVGDLNIVTDWEGKAKAIIRTSKVEQVAYKDISPEYAAIEGEGDQSLDYWKKVHWEYYTNEMKPYHTAPSEDMIIVCEYFEAIWTF